MRSSIATLATLAALLVGGCRIDFDSEFPNSNPLHPDSSCGNAVTDAGETDLDCGGPCLPCDDGRACKGDSDCQSSDCHAHLCVSCSDGLQNGSETGIDCGGSCTCATCPTRICPW